MAGEAREVADGIFWVRLPLPFRLNHVNIWLLKEDNGWTVVDTGCATEQLFAIWKTLLATVMQGQPIRRVVSTHGHVDHIGLSGWLVERFGAEFVSTFGEWCWARLAHMHEVPGARKAYFQHLTRHGIKADLANEMVGKRGGYIDLATTIPDTMTEIRDGGRIRLGNRDWEVFVTPGHSFEHASFLDRQSGIWISGDHLLPKISPVIAVYELLPDADPLGDYLSSFERFANFAADMLVLPSHGLPYRGVHDRIDELRQHHAERLEAAVRFLHSPKTSFELVRDMFPHVDDVEGVGFAFGETVAHINYLVARDWVEKTAQNDGLLLFRARTSGGQGGLRAGGIR